MMSSETSINLGFAKRWSPFRHLNQILSNAVIDKSQRILPELENSLQRHKTDFISLLKNPSRNALHKEIVMNASKDGIAVIQEQNKVKTVIPQVMVDEALLMSEIFDLNELSTLELIIAGEHQESRYPDLTRGPIAVTLYYDGRKSLLKSLQLLIQGRTGRTWSLKLPRDVSCVINKFTDQLKDEGIILRCIEQLSSLDIVSEFDLLQRNRALGSHKYRKQVLDIMKDIRQLMADIIFCFSAQCDLNKSETLKLIQLIARKGQLNSSGTLDTVTATLLMALFYALDVSFIQYSEEIDLRTSSNSLLKYPEMIAEINRYLNSTEFSVKPIKSMIQFCLAISAKTLSLFPVNGVECDNEDERLIDTAIESGVFETFNSLLANNEFVATEEFQMRKIHTLITDFIILMPIKLKELKEKGDEIGRIINAYTAEGIQPPATLARHFEKLLYFMSNFYNNDRFELSNEFWSLACDEKHMTNRQQSLNKFIRNIQDSIFAPVLHIPVIKLLKSFAINSAFNVFNLIKNSGLQSGSQFSLEYFNSSLLQYYNTVKGSDNKEKVMASANSFGFSSIQFHLHGQHRVLTGFETDILCAIIELIQVIVTNDKTCCLAIAESQEYSIISTLIGILRCAVPKELKAVILNCLSGFASSSASVSFIIWSKIDGILPKFMPTMTTSIVTDPGLQHRLWQNGIGIEIEEIEAKNEEYPITIGFLRLMKSLFSHCDANQSQQQQSSSDVCLNFIINSILLKVKARAFKLEEEKWIINKICFEILHNFIKNYEPLTEGPNSKAAFNIFSQTLQESGLFRHIISILEDIADNFEKEMFVISFQNEDIFSKLLEDCALNALKILKSICEKQNDFIEMVREIPGYPLAIIAKFDVLFNNVNPSTHTMDRLTTLIRLISLSTPVSIESIKVFNSLCKSNLEISHLSLLQLQSSNVSKVLKNDFMIINSFVECLESESKELRLETLDLILTCLDFVHPNYSFNFAHKLLGIDKTRTLLRDTGNISQTFTCFQSILSLFDSSVVIKDFSEERHLAIQILHKLCVSLYTFETVLRFLRTSYDFVIQYLQLWEKIKSDPTEDPDLEELLLPELTYFLQILAIDIKITSDQNLKSHCATYVKFLFTETKRGRILDLLSPSIFNHSHPVMPNLEFFEQKGLWKAISECSTGTKSIDLKALHQRLLNEIRLYGPQLGVVQTNLVRNELKTILTFGAALNESQQKLNIKTHYFEAWRELIEIVIITHSIELIDAESRVRYLIDILHELINRATDSSISNSLLNPISSAILIICSALYQMKSQSMASNIVSCVKSIMNTLDSSTSALWSDQKIARINFYASILYLFNSLPLNLYTEVKYSNRLLERLSKDMLSGHEVAKVLAISLLNRSELSMWFNELSSNGTLRQLLDSLLSDDREIRANKCEFVKVFYGFESKMMLFLQIFSSFKNTNYLPIHGLEIIATLDSIQSFDMYPYLVGQNQTCHKIFVNTLRLILSISNTNNQQTLNELGQFVSSRSILCDILRIAPSIKNTTEGKEVIVLISRVVSRLIAFINKNLQIAFIGLLSHYYKEFTTPEDSEIVFNILYGCTQFSRNNGLSPLFEPILSSFETNLITHQPLGQLVTILNNCSLKASEISNHLLIMESALYLLWHHFNLYFSLLNISNDKLQDVENMKNESEYTLSDAFFSKIQAITQKNTFVDALIRRLKRTIHLKKTNYSTVD